MNRVKKVFLVLVIFTFILGCAKKQKVGVVGGVVEAV
jgi:hypothetical protein